MSQSAYALPIRFPNANADIGSFGCLNVKLRSAEFRSTVSDWLNDSLKMQDRNDRATRLSDTIQLIDT